MAKPSRFHQHSELLALLDQRHKELGLGKPDYPAYRKPTFNLAGKDRVAKAVRDHATAHPSDPFAAQRIKLHIIQGYELVSDVLADAARIIQAAENERRARATRLAEIAA